MQLLRRVRKGTVQLVQPQLYAPAAYWRELSYSDKALHIIRATAKQHSDWTFCYLSAALLWGLTDTVFLRGQMHVAVTNHTHVRRQGCIKFHYTRLNRPAFRRGVAATPLLQTVYDCARRLDYCNAMAICDVAMRKFGLTQQQLIRYAEQFPHSWGQRRAFYVFTHARGLSESGGESIACALFDGWGYQQAQQQISIASPLRKGKQIRLDFLWITSDGRHIAGELDGRVKYVNPTMTQGRELTDIILNEKDRETEVSLLGFTLVRFSFQQLQQKRGSIVREKLHMAGVPQVPQASEGDNPQVRALFGSCWQETHTCWAGLRASRPRLARAAHLHDSRRPPSRPSSHIQRRPPQAMATRR
ncbi:hypothetical protein KIM372_10030 [Bombiscardovia nodaiensis]|uniref:CTP synthase n=1 Tax=Bombiscardovia nodaiensis TaxID=2932181 RepID=A0ABM8B8Q5_9BIFI|nr:hypothetical protein KIM372_10030 [Bombiscardovia nodaiensis]